MDRPNIDYLQQLIAGEGKNTSLVVCKLKVVVVVVVVERTD